jgi:hypothetical protein
MQFEYCIAALELNEYVACRVRVSTGNTVSYFNKRSSGLKTQQGPTIMLESGKSFGVAGTVSSGYDTKQFYSLDLKSITTITAFYCPLYNSFFPCQCFK